MFIAFLSLRSKYLYNLSVKCNIIYFPYVIFIILASKRRERIIANSNYVLYAQFEYYTQNKISVAIHQNYCLKKIQTEKLYIHTYIHKTIIKGIIYYEFLDWA